MLSNPKLLNSGQIGPEAQEFGGNLHSKIVGQDDAIHDVVQVYQTFLLGMSPRSHPVGSFLFLGPTGASKTRLAEATAECAAGDAKALIKIDCGEFQHGHEIAKLTGSPPGYLGHRDTHPMLSQEALNRFHTDSLKLSFVLFDEIEKANDALWNLLLGILDKATLTLGDNRRVDFSQTMIFMTGNVGAAEMSKESTPGFGLAPAVTTAKRIRDVATRAARRRFSPEFLNRIDKIVVFQQLGEPELRAVLELELKALEERFADRTRFLLSLTEAAKDFVLWEGTDVQYGARRLKRTLERSLVYPLSNLLATAQLRRGDQIRVDLDKDTRRLLFYKDAENAELPELQAKTIKAAEPQPTQMAPATPAIAAGFCF
jgi:ATP-dependent Clp protease ATP-binding subunit ClpA